MLTSSPRRSRLSWVALTVMVLAIGWMIRRQVAQSIAHAHTRSALSDIVDNLNSLAKEDVPSTKPALIAILGKRTIDWNGCEMRDGEILDAWKTPIESGYNESGATWEFRSAGRDKVFMTADDIKAGMVRPKQ